MPGFFEGMKRMVTGQPVFKPGEDSDMPIHQYKNEAAAEQQATVANYDHKAAATEDKVHPPQAMIERFECRIHDEKHVEINLFVRNHDDKILMIDKVMIFGQRHDLDHELRPGETREFMVYNGPIMTNRNYTDCELHYRTMEGDYFSAKHVIEYEEQQNHTYIPHRIRFYGPIKDI